MERLSKNIEINIKKIPTDALKMSKYVLGSLKKNLLTPLFIFKHMLPVPPLHFTLLCDILTADVLHLYHRCVQAPSETLVAYG